MTSLLAIGSIFAGDYRVLRPLSQGGMGAVYVVEQLSTGMRRALKLMRPELVSDPVLRERFAREARVGASIASEHVVAVLAAGVDGDTGMPWLVMELLDGQDLATLIDREAPMSAARTREIFEQLCHAIGAAHAAGIVHRDLKPENVFVADARRAGTSTTVKVLDFGIAKIVAEAKTSSTDAMGTPLWMAPEQTERGGRIGPPTDVWALGLIAFAMLTGRSYWLAANDRSSGVTALLREIVLDPMAWASRRAADLGFAGALPSGFDAWFAHCTAREPNERHPDATSAMRALEPLLGSTGARTVPAAPLHHASGMTTDGDAASGTAPLGALATAAAPHVPSRAPLGTTRPARSRWKTPVAAALGCTLALVGLGVGVRLLKRTETVCKFEVNDCLYLCDEGGAKSCSVLGELYERGTGGAPKDPTLARRAYERGCDRRNQEACAALSELLLSESGGPSDPRRALSLATDGCEGALPMRRACFALGRLHEVGDAGVSRDLVKAKRLYEAACKDRHGAACTRRGVLALEGPSRNEAEAKQFLDEACVQRDPAGCLALAELTPDPRASGSLHQVEAALLVACDGGLPRACARAARLAWTDWRQNDAWPNIARLLEKGCDHDVRDPLACFDRGRLFESGLGVRRDRDTASRFYADACRDPIPSDPESQLACAYARTRRAAWIVDASLRLQELERACNGGDPSGCVELASLIDAPDRQEDLRRRACTPPKPVLDPIALVACARAQGLQARRSSDPIEAERLFGEACAGGAGAACLELAERVDATWQKLPSAAKTLTKMEERVAAYVKGCRAKAPSIEACLEAEAIERSRHRFEEARALLREACDLDPTLASCPR